MPSEACENDPALMFQVANGQNSVVSYVLLQPPIELHRPPRHQLLSMEFPVKALGFHLNCQDFLLLRHHL